MKAFLTLTIILSFTYTLFGQSFSDSVEVKKGLSVRFHQKGRILNTKDLLAITSSNDMAYKEMLVARSNGNAATILGFMGGFLIGWPIGTAIAGEEPEWSSAAIGAGIIGLSIPFSIASKRHTRKAVQIYNAGLRAKQKHNTAEVNLGFISNGIGLSVTF